MTSVEQEALPFAHQLKLAITAVDQLISDLAVLQEQLQVDNNASEALRSLRSTRRSAFANTPTLAIIQIPAIEETALAEESPVQQITIDESLQFEDLKFILEERARRSINIPGRILSARCLPEVVDQVLAEEANLPSLETLEFIHALGFEPALVAAWDMKDHLLIPAFSRRSRLLFIEQFQKLKRLKGRGIILQDASFHQLLEYAALATTVKLKD